MNHFGPLVEFVWDISRMTLIILVKIKILTVIWVKLIVFDNILEKMEHFISFSEVTKPPVGILRGY